MKTIKKFDFQKHSIVELNDRDLNDVKGGSTLFCVAASSEICGSAIAAFSIWAYQYIP